MESKLEALRGGSPAAGPHTCAHRSWSSLQTAFRETFPDRAAGKELKSSSRADFSSSASASNSSRVLPARTRDPSHSQKAVATCRRYSFRSSSEFRRYSPQLFGYVMDRAFELGALDCYLT